jgi:dephospho-CoA kinase
MTTNKGIRAGITGGIGTGKTTVCRLFHETFGIPVYYADEWARRLITEDKQLAEQISILLGEQAYLPDGSYNRAYVASVVFENPEKLAALNALVHPAVEKHSLEWHREQTEAGAPYTLKEAALLVESGAWQYLDFLIVVTAPETLRIERVMQRDKITEAQVRARMKSQLPESEKLGKAQAIIQNDGGHDLLTQVTDIHHRICGINQKV